MKEKLDFDSIIKKLNSIVYTMNASRKNLYEKSRLKFLSGGLLEGIKQVVRLCAPFGKVAFVSENDSYEKYSKIVLDAVKEADGTFLGLTVKGNRIETTEGIAELFHLPEDVRLIIAMDKFVSEKATYFASIRNIPILIIPTSCFAESYLKPEILIKADNGIDAVKMNPDKYVLFSEEAFKEDNLSSVYAHIVSKLVALKDYIISCAVGGKKPNKFCYTTIKNAVYHTINLIKENDISSIKLLIENSFLIETVNNVTCGQMSSFSAETVSALISSVLGNDYYESEIKCATKILEFYLALVNETEEKILLFPDYNERAEELSKKLEISETAVLKGFLMQSEVLLNSRKTAETIVKRLKGELKRETEAKKKILSKYYFLGGEDCLGNESVNLSVKYSGDFPFGINLMSIVRENGITEII